jgi:hypothetical protein
MYRLALAAAAAFTLTACADTGYGSYGYPGHGYASADIAYYDNFYGPWYDGYWGDGDVFFYRVRPNGPYVRDDAHHFRHDRAQGYRAWHGHRGSRWH